MRIVVAESDKLAGTGLIGREGFKLRAGHSKKLKVLLRGLALLQKIIMVEDGLDESVISSVLRTDRTVWEGKTWHG